MSTLVILLLVGLWAAILLPAAMRARRQRQPLASANGFARTMTALAGGKRPTPRFHGPGRAAALLRRVPRPVRWRALLARPASPSARRRRTIITGLAAALAGAVVAGAVVGGLAWAPAAVAGAALAVYLGLVVVFVTRARGRRRVGGGRHIAGGGRHIAGAGGRGGHPAPSSEAAAARAAAVRAAVTRAPAGEAPSAPARAPAGEAEPAHAGATRPLEVESPDGVLTHAAGGPTATVGQGGDAGVRALATDARASASQPQVPNVSGTAGLVTIRTLPRAGGWPE